MSSSPVHLQSASSATRYKNPQVTQSISLTSLSNVSVKHSSQLIRTHIPQTPNAMNKRTMSIRPRSKDTPHPMMEEFPASSSSHASNTTSKPPQAGEATPLPTHDTTDRDPRPPDPPKPPNPPKPRPNSTVAHSDTDPFSPQNLPKDPDPNPNASTTTNPPPAPRLPFAKPTISALAASAVLAAINTTPISKRKAAELSPGRPDSATLPPWELSGGDGGVRRGEGGRERGPTPAGDPNPPPAGPPPPKSETGEGPKGGRSCEGKEEGKVEGEGRKGEKEGERGRGPGCPGPPPTKPLPPTPKR